MLEREPFSCAWGGDVHPLRNGTPRNATPIGDLTTGQVTGGWSPVARPARAPKADCRRRLCAELHVSHAPHPKVPTRCALWGFMQVPRALRARRGKGELKPAKRARRGGARQPEVNPSEAGRGEATRGEANPGRGICGRTTPCYAWARNSHRLKASGCTSAVCATHNLTPRTRGPHVPLLAAISSASLRARLRRATRSNLQEVIRSPR